MSIFKHNSTGELVQLSATVPMDGSDVKVCVFMPLGPLKGSMPLIALPEGEFKARYSLMKMDMSVIQNQGLSFDPLLSILQGAVAWMDLGRAASGATDATSVDKSVMFNLWASEVEAYLLEMGVAGLFLPMVVKIQRPVARYLSNAKQEEKDVCLVYNQDQSFLQELELDSRAMSMFGDSYKIYATARLWVDGTFQVVEVVDAQPW